MIQIAIFLKDFLFGGVKLTKNADQDKYIYSSYSIGFDSHSIFSLPILIGVKMLLFLELI